jgi:hypothetical protein
MQIRSRFEFMVTISFARASRAQLSLIDSRFTCRKFRAGCNWRKLPRLGALIPPHRLEVPGTEGLPKTERYYRPLLQSFRYAFSFTYDSDFASIAISDIISAKH